MEGLKEVEDGEKITTNWIPASYQKAAENIAREAVRRFVRPHQVIGLGSGPMAASIIREMANYAEKETLKCIPSSFQIKLEAECSGLELVDESKIPEIEVVFDGADEVDSKLNMIKGGGGALLREKILHSASKQVIIAAESKKFVPKFTWPVPIEIHPFAIHTVRKKLEGIGGRPKMRMLKEGYPYVTENDNFILDTHFEFLQQNDDDDYDGNNNSILQQEAELKSIAGIVEVGLFPYGHIDAKYCYYKAKEDGSFETIVS